MKKSILAVIMAAALMISSGIAFAGGIGFVDYEQVVENCNFALNAKKQIDTKAMELKQYMFDKEKEYEAIQSPVQKQNFQDRVTAELKQKQNDFLRLQAQTEQNIFVKIREIAKEIMVEQKLDAIISDKAVFCGGVDVTQTLINRLKTVK